MRRFALPALCLLVLTHLLPPSAAPESVRHSLAPGVVFLQEILPPPKGPLVINVLRVNLKAPGVRVQAALGRDVVLTDEPAKGRESIGDLAARHGAVAAVNADFFPFTGDPLGLAIRDGELLSEGMAHRAAMGITADGQVLFDTLLPVGTLRGPGEAVTALDGINRPLARDEIVLLTPAFGARARVGPADVVVPLSKVHGPVRAGQEQEGLAGEMASGDPNGAIPADGAVLAGSGRGAEWLRANVRAGDVLRFRFDLVSNPLPPGPPRGDLASRAGALRGRIGRSAWTEVVQAVGGGPWLVRDGQIAVDGVEQGFPEREFVHKRHPRTAAGVTASGELLLVAVDGRQRQSQGLSLPELAAYMKRIGAVRAINLDGGGSTAMVVRGLYVNSPSDGAPRPVANALLVFAKTGAETADAPETILEPIIVRAGERVALSLPRTADGSQPQTLWGTLEGRAFVDQRGVLTALRAGEGTALAHAGAQRVRLPFTVQPGPPARLQAAFLPVPNNPPDRHYLTLSLTDAYGNPVPQQPVDIRVSGGTAERARVLTGADGKATVEIVWDVETGRRAVVSYGSLTPVALTTK